METSEALAGYERVPLLKTFGSYMIRNMLTFRNITQLNLKKGSAGRVKKNG